MIQETKDIIKDCVLGELVAEKRTYELHKMMVECFKKFEGKKITKRMTTELKKLLPNWVVYLRREYGQINICIWQHDSRDRDDFFMGYEDGEHGGIYREGKHDEMHSGFEYYSTRTGEACRIRIKRSEQLLEDNATLTCIALKVDAFKKATKELDAIRFDYRYAAWKKLELKG
jgi:hypothetical protein